MTEETPDTTLHPPIRVGTVVVAKLRSGVCEVGERGVCYEVYTLGERPGYSFIFERGRYDGFSPEDVAVFLTITETRCRSIAGYRFRNVNRLMEDFHDGIFAEAFSPPQHGR